MKRGRMKRREVNKWLILERETLGEKQTLKIDQTLCVGCGICVVICPQEAPMLSKSVIQDGKLIRKKDVDVDAKRCTLCGECVVLCPTHAIKEFRNGEESIPVIKADVFPQLIKDVTVLKERCDPTCDLVCQENCPTEAIKVDTHKTKSGKITNILDVKVDNEKCIFCGRCEVICPQNAIHTAKPFQGIVRLNTGFCPKNCQVCVDVCPTKTITLNKKGKVKIEEEFCIYCGACEEACPEEAIKVERQRVSCTPIKSGAWIRALEKLTPYSYVDKEFYAKSMKKLKENVEKIGRF